MASNRLVFLHIPKCGGTSFHEILVQRFSSAEVCPERLSFLDRIPEHLIGSYRLYSGHYFIDQIERIPEPKVVFSWLRDPVKRLLSLYYFFRSHGWEHIENCERLGFDSPRLAKELNLLAYLRRPDWTVRQYVHNAITRHLIGLNYIGQDGRLLVSSDEAFAIATTNLRRLAAFGILENYAEAHPRFSAVLGFALPEQLPRLNRFEALSARSSFETIERDSKFDSETEMEIQRNTEIDNRIYEWANVYLKKLKSSSQRPLVSGSHSLRPVSRQHPGW